LPAQFGFKIFILEPFIYLYKVGFETFALGQASSIDEQAIRCGITESCRVVNWDSGNLQVLTKNDPNKATGANVSILAHITQEELTLLNRTEQANGFANRFVWLNNERSKMIPVPTGLPAADVDNFVAQLNEAKMHAAE
jgi:hypothetical protein